MQEKRAMGPWITLGIFLLGAGAGSLASAVLHAEQTRKLKDMLAAAAADNHAEERVHKSDGRKSG
jgi:hypothetical protein